MARALRAGGGTDPFAAGRQGPAAGARRLDVGAGARRQADHRHRAGGAPTPPTNRPTSRDLEAGGYVLRGREPDWFEHRLFKGTDPAVNLHVFSEGSPEIDRTLAFRDRLRTDEDDRRLYEATKRELAARDWVYVQDYADAKDEIVAAILGRAMAERG